MNQRPHIAFLSFAPEVGGVTTYQALQLEHLAGRARLTFIDERPETTFDLLTRRTRDAIELVRLPIWCDARASSAPLIARWRRDPPHCVAISNPGLLVRLVRPLMEARDQGAQIVHTVHSGVLTPTPRRRLMELAAAAVSLRVADQVYVSAFTRRLWESRFPWLHCVPARVVHNGAPRALHVTEPRTLERAPRIGFVGRLHREKGIDRFLEVAHMAMSLGKPWQFHVFGDGPEMPAVRAAAQTVRWHGHVADLSAVFEAIDLLLVPSPVENCPYVVLEAKQHGVPSVAASTGGLPEIIASGVDGLLSPTRSVANLMSSLTEAVRSYGRLASGCVRRRHEFEVEAQVRTTWEPHLPGSWPSAVVGADALPTLAGSDA